MEKENKSCFEKEITKKLNKIINHNLKNEIDAIYGLNYLITEVLAKNENTFKKPLKEKLFFLKYKEIEKSIIEQVFENGRDIIQNYSDVELEEFKNWYFEDHKKMLAYFNKQQLHDYKSYSYLTQLIKTIQKKYKTDEYVKKMTPEEIEKQKEMFNNGEGQ